MKKLFAFVAMTAFAAAHAQEQYLGLYMQGNKIGYSSYKSQPEMFGNETVSRSDSRTVMSAGLLGADMKMTMEGTTWTSSTGKPLKLLFSISSAGRTQKVTAIFKGKTAEIDIDNNGQKSRKSLPIPDGATIVDDPLSVIVGGDAVAGAKKTIYVLDPMTVTLLKTDIVLVGPSSTTVNGAKVEATLVHVIDPRITMNVYVSGKGDLVKAEAMGIEMIPETRERALDNQPVKYKPSADLAFVTSIRPDKKIADPAALTGLKMRISGRDLSRLPSDSHQTVKKQGNAWIVDVHPPKQNPAKSATIAAAGKQKPEWLKPSMNVPADSPAFRELAAKILKGEKKVLPGALAIKAYVNKLMTPNAGIGVLRDATEVLATKEGVCRDYAILTAAIMRAGGIPTRLCSGLVNWQGDFFYHAWVEVWDGGMWIGIDSTVPQKQISASHVKLADGNVEEAFAFTFLDKVKVEVLDLRRK